MTKSDPFSEYADTDREEQCNPVYGLTILENGYYTEQYKENLNNIYDSKWLSSDNFKSVYDVFEKNYSSEALRNKNYDNSVWVNGEPGTYVVKDENGNVLEQGSYDGKNSEIILKNYGLENYSTVILELISGERCDSYEFMIYDYNSNDDDYVEYKYYSEITSEWYYISYSVSEGKDYVYTDDEYSMMQIDKSRIDEGYYLHEYKLHVDDETDEEYYELETTFVKYTENDVWHWLIDEKTNKLYIDYIKKTSTDKRPVEDVIDNVKTGNETIKSNNSNNRLVVIKDNDTSKVVAKDHVSNDIVKTGDESNFVLYITLASISLLGIAVTAVIIAKKKIA